MLVTSRIHPIRRGATIAIAIASTMMLAPLVSAQSVMDDETAPAPAPTIQLVQQHINQQNFREAQIVCEKLLEANINDARAWFLLGYARHAEGDLDRALVAHLMATEIGPPQTVPVASYNIACVYSLKNNADKAFEWLEKARGAGFQDSNTLQNDTDMDNIRDDDRFEAFAKSIARASNRNSGGTVPSNVPLPVAVIDPVRAAALAGDDAGATTAPTTIDWSKRPARRQFDFWVGDWNAVDANGRVVGRNTITLREGNNIVHESWRGAGSDGGTGQSINYYDPGLKKWRQDWVSRGGGVVHYVGEFRDGAMRYEGEHITANGQKVTKARCTFTPLSDGRVHHFIEHSTDGGKSWTKYFEAHYVARDGS